MQLWSIESPQLDAIRESVPGSPDDDARRLVFADWLQEHGHPWGEVINVQCAIEAVRRAEPRLPELAGLLRREHELLTDRSSWWPFDGSGFVVEELKRGFPTKIRCDSVASLRSVRTRMPWLPDVALGLRRLSLAGTPVALEDACSPALEALDISGWDWAPVGGPLPDVRELDLSATITDDHG